MDDDAPPPGGGMDRWDAMVKQFRSLTMFPACDEVSVKLMKYIFCFLFGGLSFLSALGDEPVVQKDIVFLGAGRSEKADVYTPPGNHTAPLPAVLMIHGGGWAAGDKADPRWLSVNTDLANAGYVVFSINYQLSRWNGNPMHGVPLVWHPGWPQNIYDCKSALRFMKKQAAQLGIDPTRIAVMGLSAGGHLALLVGSTEHVDDLNSGGLYTDQSNDVSCIVDLYGPPDLSAPDRKKQVVNFSGKTDAETADNIRRASPITYIDAKMPPTLILHGSIDNMVAVDQSRQLADRLKQLGVPYQYVEIPGMGHGFDLRPKPDRAHPQSMSMDLRPVVFDFLKKYLGEPKSGP